MKDKKSERLIRWFR